MQYWTVINDLSEKIEEFKREFSLKYDSKRGGKVQRFKEMLPFKG